MSGTEHSAFPFVSVIIPVLNRKDWVIDAVASIRAQDYPADRFELIVVDNGSSDGTWEWLQENCNDGDRFHSYPNQTELRVPSGSRNIGIRRSRGDVIALTDSDCIADSAWIRSGVAGFRPGIGIVVGRTIPPESDPIGPLSKVKVVDSEGFYDACNIFYSREAIDRAKGFDEELLRVSLRRPIVGEDTELALRVKAMGYRSVFHAMALIRHRVRSQTPWQWLIEPTPLYWCAYMVKRYPELRKDMMYLRYFLSPITAGFDLLVIGLGLATLVSPWFLLFALPFVVLKLREGGSRLNPVLSIARVCGASVRAAYIFGLLVCGSIRFRGLIL